MATSVLIFTPAFREQLSLQTHLSVCNLLVAFMQKGIGGGISGASFPDIAELRNLTLSMWYDTTPHSHLLFVDDDMSFEPGLVIDMLTFNEPVVGALYRKRTMEIAWAGSGFADNKPLQRRGAFALVSGVGMGITLIRRDAIAKMLEKMPHLVDTRLAMHMGRVMMEQAGAPRLIRAFDKIDDPDHGQLSEDISFCRRWNECGGEVWASIAHKISHIGPHAFEGCYLTEAVKKEKADEPAKINMAEEFLKRSMR